MEDVTGKPRPIEDYETAWRFFAKKIIKFDFAEGAEVMFHYIVAAEVLKAVVETMEKPTTPEGS